MIILSRDKFFQGGQRITPKEYKLYMFEKIHNIGTYEVRDHETGIVQSVDNHSLHKRQNDDKQYILWKAGTIYYVRNIK